MGKRTADVVMSALLQLREQLGRNLRTQHQQRPLTRSAQQRAHAVNTLGFKRIVITHTRAREL
jgi:Holliday junction resolvasome RuvABC DNA-binding subunit